MIRFGSVMLAGAVALAPVPVMSQSNPATMFMPTPLSIVLMVGRWLSEPNQPRVYHIRVQARGDTESQARQEAYKRAIDEAIGSLVLSESVVVNEERRRREIIEYSSGFVDRSRVINQSHDGRHFVIDMEVWVRHSAIADRLLIKAESTKQVDGPRIQQQVETLNYERDQAVRVLSVVLDDYPHRAYDIRNQTLEVRYVNRQAQLTVEFDLSLNASYLYALWETLKTTSQSANAGYCRNACSEEYIVHMIGRHDRVLFNRWEYTFGFTDPQSLDAIWKATVGSRPAVMLTVKDGGGRPIHRECHRWAQIDGAVNFTYPAWQFVQFQDRNDRVSIDGRNILRGQIQITGPDVKSLQTIELSMVRGTSCPG